VAAAEEAAADKEAAADMTVSVLGGMVGHAT